MKANKRAPRKEAIEDLDDRDYRKVVAAHWRKMDAMLRKRKPIERSLSQIKFQSQHWWKQQPWCEQFLNASVTSIDTQKAAAIYEATRRRPEVQQVWLEHRDLIGVNGWLFAGLVSIHLKQSWIELDEGTRKAWMHAIHHPLFVPPLGYSTFPEDAEKIPSAFKTDAEKVAWRAETKERREAADSKCREAAAEILPLPESDDIGELRGFILRARKLVDAGFLIVAVDNKTKHSVHYAFQAVEREARSFRRADRIQKATAHLPPDLPQEERAALEAKRKAGTLTFQDVEEAWSKHEIQRHEKELRERLASGKTLEEINREDAAKQLEAAQNGDAWSALVSFTDGIIGKRKREGRPIESKIFNFTMICREFERLDAGSIGKADFVQRLRLS